MPILEIPTQDIGNFFSIQHNGTSLFAVRKNHHDSFWFDAVVAYLFANVNADKG
jgi:hypothetical protein